MPVPPKKDITSFNDLENSGAPSVDFLNSTMPAEPIKSTIGIRKIQPKRVRHKTKNVYKIHDLIVKFTVDDYGQKRRNGCDQGNDKLCRCRAKS